MLLDGRFGFEALAEAADHDYWIGRPIELPKSRPLEFESSADVATELAEWPLNHVVKCLVFYHPDDEAELRERRSASCFACSTPAARPATNCCWR
jgi:5-dehydro-2-deoxygluconokinase